MAKGINFCTDGSLKEGAGGAQARGGGCGDPTQGGTGRQPPGRHATKPLLTLGNAHENAAKHPKAELRLQPQEHSTVPGAAADGDTPRGDPASPRGWTEAFQPLSACAWMPPEHCVPTQLRGVLALPPSPRGPQEWSPSSAGAVRGAPPCMAVPWCCCPPAPSWLFKSCDKTFTEADSQIPP